MAPNFNPLGREEQQKFMDMFFPTDDDFLPYKVVVSGLALELEENMRLDAAADDLAIMPLQFLAYGAMAGVFEAFMETLPDGPFKEAMIKGKENMTNIVLEREQKG